MMGAIGTHTNEMLDVEQGELHRSLFGLYARLPGDGSTVQLDLGESVTASLASCAGEPSVLRLAAPGAHACIDIPATGDIETLRNSVMSRWMGEHFAVLPWLPLEGVLSLIISQASTSDLPPEWPNARLKIHQWEHILSHALDVEDPVVQASRIVAGLALYTALLANLRACMPPSSVLLGLDAALEEAHPECNHLVRSMADRIAKSDGLLLVSERCVPADAEAFIMGTMRDAGWLALVGNRPLEACALQIARSQRIPAILLDSDKMKSSPVLENIDRVVAVGDKDRFGVMRRRAIRLVDGFKEP